MRPQSTRLGRLVLVSSTVLLAACPREHQPTNKGDRVRIRSFTDSTPVADIAVVGSEIFVAAGVELARSDLSGTARTQLGADNGLDAGRVYALAPDPAHGDLWVLAGNRVTRFDTQEGRFVDLPDPPDEVARLVERSAIAPSGDGGVFVGGPFGLYASSAQGDWKRTEVADPVTSLVRGPKGGLWVGTDKGLKLIDERGVTPLGPEQGVDLVRIRSLALGPEGAPVVLGENAEGQQRVVIVNANKFSTYRVSPKMDWVKIAGDGQQVVALDSSNALFLLSPSSGLRKLGRDVIELLPAPPAGTPLVPVSPLAVTRIPGRTPTGVTALALASGRVIVGTRDQGTGILKGKAWTWIRRAELTHEARFLSVACVARDDCFVANGSSRAWRFDGKVFAIPGLDRPIEAFVRRPSGEIYALFRREDDAIGVAQWSSASWQVLEGMFVRLADGRTELSFARFSPSGLLWLGVGYVDESGDVRPRGVALVDMNVGAVSYHHASDDADALKKGILPVPINSVDVSFLGMDEVWLATTQGAVRLKGTEVKLYSEADGLRSEILRGIACSAAGMVYVGSGQGVGAYDGESWKYPSGLSAPVNDIRFADDGRLWIGTDRGLTAFDGAKVRKLDARRGLLEDRVLDIDIDHFGRLWLRGPESITVVVP